jgi:hypothetical protein
LWLIGFGFGLSVCSLGVSPGISIADENISQSAIAVQSHTLEDNSFAQVTSISQLSDVKPTDWAFQALKSLIERYGCIVGYPNKTYYGNQALSRYEFAAGLNACLDKVQELLAASTSDLVKKSRLDDLVD